MSYECCEQCHKKKMIYKGIIILGIVLKNLPCLEYVGVEEELTSSSVVPLIKLNSFPLKTKCGLCPLNPCGIWDSFSKKQKVIWERMYLEEL